PLLVRRNESIADVDSLDAVLSDLDSERRPAQIVPDAHHSQGWKEFLAALDSDRHPSEHTIPVALKSEIARGCRHVGEDFEIGLGGEGLDVRRLVGARSSL